MQLTKSTYHSLLFFVFIVPLFFGALLTYQKISFADDVNFSAPTELKQAEGGEYDGFVVLFNDEITYLTWIIHRSDSLQKTLDGERGLLINLYGYVISFVFLITDGNWKILFLFGALGYFIFIYSSAQLLNTLFVNERLLITFTLTIIAFSPSVINLSSGFMRDLFLLSAINYCFIALLKKRLFKFLLFLIIVAALRNFMVVVLFPVFIYFYFYYENTILGLNKNTVIISCTLFLAILLCYILYLSGSIHKSPTVIIIRFIELITGFNQVLVNVDVLYRAKGALAVEVLSNIYQWLVLILLYITIVKSKFRVNSFFTPFVCTALLISIPYGLFLGFFVARTKLIILWLSVLYISMYLHRRLFKIKCNKLLLKNEC